MSEFNNKSRMSNALKTSIVGGITNIIKIILGFGYRTIFLFVLSEVYLGINGLFTNILQILSLTELGVTTAIVYRFYDPIGRGDKQYVGMLMNFFKRVYLTIAGVILCLGIVIMPFMKFLINDVNEIPADVNLYIAYLLFLANTLSSYIFSYKITLLSADQKNYVAAIIDLITTIVRYGLQIIVLVVSHNFIMTLAIGVFATLFVNFVCSIWVTKQYRSVFEVKEMLPKEEQKKIFSDTRACLYHKIGYTVLTGTDNAILSKMVSLAATGLYSNYSMIITYIQNFLTQVLGNFTSSVGNALQRMDKEDYYKLFKKMNFLGLWVASVITICVYVSIDDFISLWIGKKYVLGGVTTAVLCIQMYITISRIVHGAFVNADGLFVKDKIRPLIEAVLNIIVSIILTYKLGIAGVFLGTIVSTLLTAWWREPLILYRYSFKENVFDYWKIYSLYSAITFLSCWAFGKIKQMIFAFDNNFSFLVIECFSAFVIINAILYLIFRKSEEYQYMEKLAVKFLLRNKKA